MKKEPRESWEDVERLGPYQLHEQMPQDELSRGELYRATHETSGVVALVFKPSEGAGGPPPGDWRVRCVSSAEPGYVALEAEDSRLAVAPNKHSVEALTCLFEAVRGGLGRMAAAFPVYDEPRSWRRLGLALASVAMVCVLVFALVRMDFAPSGSPEPLARAEPAPGAYEGPMDAGGPEAFTSGLLGDTTPLGEFVLARPLPREPFKGQKRPPCNRRIEVELIGACWGPHELKAPCPDELYEHQGKCYLPIFSARPPPQSFGQ